MKIKCQDFNNCHATKDDYCFDPTYTSYYNYSCFKSKHKKDWEDFILLILGIFAGGLFALWAVTSGLQWVINNMF